MAASAQRAGHRQQYWGARRAEAATPSDRIGGGDAGWLEGGDRDRDRDRDRHGDAGWLEDDGMEHGEAAERRLSSGRTASLAAKVSAIEQEAQRAVALSRSRRPPSAEREDAGYDVAQTRHHSVAALQYGEGARRYQAGRGRRGDGDRGYSGYDDAPPRPPR